MSEWTAVDTALAHAVEFPLPASMLSNDQADTLTNQVGLRAPGYGCGMAQAVQVFVAEIDGGFLHLPGQGAISNLAALLLAPTIHRINRVDFEVRISRAEDLPAVQHLNHALFEHDHPYDAYLEMSWPYDEKTGAAYFADRVLGRSGICFVAESDGKLIGYLAGDMKGNELYRTGRRAELENMFVVEHARRSGVGGALVSRFRRWCTEQGADEVYVSAYFDNNEAVAFYRSCGFASWSHNLVLDQRTDKINW